MTASESWHRIAAWAAANIPQEEFRLAPGASEQEIVELEQLLGFSLPDDLRESYRIHNGTEGTVFPSHTELEVYEGLRVSMNYGELVTLERMRNEYGYIRRFEEDNFDAEIQVPQIKPDFWSSQRLVVTYDASSSGLRVDLDPAEAGFVGQVIFHDSELGPTNFVAPSWAALLERIAADIEAGIYYYAPDYPWSRRDLEIVGENSYIWKR